MARDRRSRGVYRTSDDVTRTRSSTAAGTTRGDNTSGDGASRRDAADLSGLPPWIQAFGQRAMDTIDDLIRRLAWRRGVGLWHGCLRRSPATPPPRGVAVVAGRRETTGLACRRVRHSPAQRASACVFVVYGLNRCASFAMARRRCVVIVALGKALTRRTVAKKDEGPEGSKPSGPGCEGWSGGRRDQIIEADGWLRESELHNSNTGGSRRSSRVLIVPVLPDACQISAQPLTKQPRA